ncbi:MAG: YjbQ family protein [Sphaerobacteraceae bacterium]|nr:MAG: YjbQ family protein [Sphaerobacteraceae bacterium]
MQVSTHQLTIQTEGVIDMHDITGEVQRTVQQSGCQNGLVTAFVRHTTAAIMIGEYEPGLIHDMPAYIERLAPAGVDYRHNQVNHDDNAHSHLAGSVIGPSETIPVVDGRLVLGTWQQIILIELDTHPRSREVVIQVVGE